MIAQEEPQPKLIQEPEAEDDNEEAQDQQLTEDLFANVKYLQIEEEVAENSIEVFDLAPESSEADRQEE